MDKEFKKILKSFLPGLFLVAGLWLVKFFEWKSGYELTEYGVLPRTISGIKGIFLSPFIHADFNHLFSNSVPLFILVSAIIYFYEALALRVFLGVYLLGGFWLWLGGRESYHIGASGLIYGFTAFLFFSGVFRRDTRLMALSLLVVFLYGGMVWGIFPLFRDVSWEAHLFGAFAGILFSFIYRNEGPRRKLYQWEQEDESDIPDDENAYWKIPEQNPNPPPAKESEINPGSVNIHYIYKPSEQQGETTNKDDEKN